MYIKNTIIYLLISLCFVSVCIGCSSSERNRITQDDSIPNTSPTANRQNPDPQIAQYIRNIIEDKDGNLWFGTNGYGVAYYDGDSVSYFTNEQGFNGHQITGMTQDPEGNLWFATDEGIVKYDGSISKNGEKQFTNYSDSKIFGKQHFWSVFADSKGNIWAGAARGIFRTNGVRWVTFDLPYTLKGEDGDFITNRTTWGITEDKEGNIWFSTNGEGAFKYDGVSFTQYTEKDGLTNNQVDDIISDTQGNMWFGTRYKGVSRYDGETFTNYHQMNSIGNDEVCVVYEDKSGDIWFSSEGFGVYRYDPTTTAIPVELPFDQILKSTESTDKTLKHLGLTNYNDNAGLGVKAVQTIYEDSKGRLWVGGGGGLYRFDTTTERFINVTKNGPWD